MTSGRLLTLKKSDQEFSQYIWGHFSQTERALPLRSVNVNTEQEQVTFQIVPRNSHWTGSLFFQTLKFRNLYLSLIPLFLVLVKNLLDEALEDEILAGLSCLAVIFLQLGIELANDVQDHIRGLDRIHPGAGNLAITKAWLSAADLKKYSWLLLIVGGLLALPSLLIFPMILTTILPLAILVTLGTFLDRIGLKYRSWSEWVVFMMFGPLLTTGFQMSFGGGFDIEVVLIGLLSGWIAVFHIHLKNFNHLMVNTQASFKSTIVKLGFDSGKRLLILWWIFFVFGMVAYHSIYSSAEWMYIQAIVLVVISVPLISTFSKLQASLGSKSLQAVQLAMRISQFALGLWLLENVWTYFLLEVFL